MGKRNIKKTWKHVKFPYLLFSSAITTLEPTTKDGIYKFKLNKYLGNEIDLWLMWFCDTFFYLFLYNIMVANHCCCLLTFPLFIFPIYHQIYIYNFSWFILTNKHLSPLLHLLYQWWKFIVHSLKHNITKYKSSKSRKKNSVLFVTWIFNLMMENFKNTKHKVYINLWSFWFLIEWHKPRSNNGQFY